MAKQTKHAATNAFRDLFDFAMEAVAAAKRMARRSAKSSSQWTMARGELLCRLPVVAEAARLTPPPSGFTVRDAVENVALLEACCTELLAVRVSTKASPAAADAIESKISGLIVAASRAAEVFRVWGAVAALEQRGESPPLPCNLVTRAQIAKLVHLEESAMTRYTKEWPKPMIPAAGRRPAQWSYAEIIPKLKQQFPHENIPERIPKDADA